MSDESYCCPECGHADPQLQPTCDGCKEVFYIWESTSGSTCQDCMDAAGLS